MSSRACWCLRVLHGQGWCPSAHTSNSLPPLLCRQVRASNLQDLVYKQGQAGVTKATVSIVFDNAAKDRSPVGYEHLDEITVTRQLVIGGRSKYMINGRVAEPSCVGRSYEKGWGGIGLEVHI